MCLSMEEAVPVLYYLPGDPNRSANPLFGTKDFCASQKPRVPFPSAAKNGEARDAAILIGQVWH